MVDAASTCHVSHRLFARVQLMGLDNSLFPHSSLDRLQFLRSQAFARREVACNRLAADRHSPGATVEFGRLTSRDLGIYLNT